MVNRRNKNTTAQRVGEFSLVLWFLNLVGSKQIASHVVGPPELTLESPPGRRM
jgi:hypothetical protein